MSSGEPLGWFKYEHFTSALVGIIFWSILCRRIFYYNNIIIIIIISPKITYISLLYLLMYYNVSYDKVRSNYTLGLYTKTYI